MQLEQAQGQLARDQATLENARSELRRNELAREAIAAQVLEAAQAAVAQAEGVVKSDQAAVHNADLQLTYARVTSPVTGPLDSLNRVFISVNSKKGSSIHSFGATLPLLGEINLGGGEIMRVTAQETGYLRAQSYDVYTAQGWKPGRSGRTGSPASGRTRTAG